MCKKKCFLKWLCIIIGIVFILLSAMAIRNLSAKPIERVAAVQGETGNRVSDGEVRDRKDESVFVRCRGDRIFFTDREFAG